MKRLRARFVFTASLVLCIAAVIASLSLFPSLISVRIARASLPAQAEISESARDDQTQNARALALVAALSPLANATSSPAEVLFAALGERPAGMSITAMSYSKGKIELSGVATNREAVSVMRDALEKDGRFSSVTVPVAAIVGTQEGRFTMTLTGDF